MQPHQQPIVTAPKLNGIIDSGDGRLQATFPIHPQGGRQWTAKLNESLAASSFAPGIEVSVDDEGRGFRVIGPREHFNQVLKQQLDSLVLIATRELAKTLTADRAAAQSTLLRTAQFHKDNADTLKKMGF